jgi:bis(5'-adenosyl)-triphosphatase
VHAHIIPRKRDDLAEQGGTDAIYGMMESEDGDLQRQFVERDGQKKNEQVNGEKRGRFPAVDNEGRKPRSHEEMQKEAEWLAEEMAVDAKHQK